MYSQNFAVNGFETSKKITKNADFEKNAFFQNFFKNNYQYLINLFTQLIDYNEDHFLYAYNKAYLFELSKNDTSQKYKRMDNFGYFAFKRNI
jgi:hypothetical protein